LRDDITKLFGLDIRWAAPPAEEQRGTLEDPRIPLSSPQFAGLIVREGSLSDAGDRVNKRRPPEEQLR